MTLYIAIYVFYMFIVRCVMKILMSLVIIIGIISLIGTLLIAGKGDSNYSSATKKNTTNLTLIYVVIIPLAVIALGIYIVRL